MALPVHQRGWLDTAGRISNTFKDDVLVKSLITRNGDILVAKEDLSEAEASRWAMLLTYGAYVIAEVSLPPIPHIKAVSVGELIAPVLPHNYFLSPANANTKIRSIIKYYLNNETPMNRGRTKAHFIETHNNIAEDEQGEDYEQIDPQASDDNLLTSHGDVYCQFLMMDSNTDLSMKPLDLFTTLYVAVAKRGNVTGDFLTKISNGMMDDLQYNANLDEDVVALVYRFYGGFINATNAPIILERWLNDIPEIALRVRLTLQQATNSGLTSFVTIGRAIKKYPDFPWTKANILTGGELANFNAAITAVNGNQYYGFNKSLGAARSTQFSSIGYIAKELLINLNGEVSLKKYAGWVRAPKNAAVIKAMIEAYKAQYVARIEDYEPTDAENENMAALITTVSNAANADIFA